MSRALYHTYDLALAAFLVADGNSRLVDITGSGDSRKQFCFSPPPSKEQLIRFYSGEAKVSARRFAEAFATLKGAGFTMKQYT